MVFLDFLVGVHWDLEQKTVKLDNANGAWPSANCLSKMLVRNTQYNPSDTPDVFEHFVLDTIPNALQVSFITELSQQPAYL